MSHKWRRAARYVTRRYHNTSSVTQMEKSRKICNQKIPQYQQCHTNGEEQQDMSPEDTTIPAVSHKWRRAARYVTRRYHNTSSVTQMQYYPHWQTLEQRMAISGLTMLYKITNNRVAIPASSYLTPWSHPTTRSHYATCHTAAIQIIFK